MSGYEVDILPLPVTLQVMLELLMVNTSLSDRTGEDVIPTSLQPQKICG